MADERRKHNRIGTPLEGTWRGASGARPCRIGDVSVGGCFVQSLACPEKSESTVVTVTFGDRALSLSGTVLYVEPGMGFAVKFDRPAGDQLQELQRLLQMAGHRAA